MGFVNVIKPTHICNLACTYCYNDDVRDPIMREATLLRTIEQTFEYVRNHKIARDVDFIWHGGEPTVAGLEFYKRAVAFQKQLSQGIPYKNLFQTNGILINDSWIEFFLENDFGVSTSLDGPKHLHDQYRLTYKGKGSFDKVFAAIQRMKAAGLQCGVCLVASKATVDHLEEIFDFFSENRLSFNIIPMNKSGSAREKYTDVGLDDGEYGDAWIRMYDRWFDATDNYIYCQDFTVKTRAILRGKAADCIGLATCSHFNMSTDPVGDIYPCASLSGTPAICYGNILEQDLGDLLNSKVASEFRTRPVDDHCTSCKWNHVCHGGCAARAYKFFGRIDRRDYYCPSLYKMYEHVQGRLRQRGIEPAEKDPRHTSDGFAPAAYATLYEKLDPAVLNTTKTRWFAA